MFKRVNTHYSNLLEFQKLQEERQALLDEVNLVQNARPLGVYSPDHLELPVTPDRLVFGYNRID